MIGARVWMLAMAVAVLASVATADDCGFITVTSSDTSAFYHCTSAASIMITDNANVGNAWFPLLEQVNGAILIQNCASLTAISMRLLRNAYYFSISDNVALRLIDMPALTSTSTLRLSNNAVLDQFHVENINHVDNVYAQNMPWLSNFAFPVLTTVGSLSIVNMPVLGTEYLDLHSLTSVQNQLTIQGPTYTRDLKLAIQTIPTLTLRDNQWLTSISLGSLTSVNSLTIENNNAQVLTVNLINLAQDPAGPSSLMGITTLYACTPKMIGFWGARCQTPPSA